MFCGTFRYRPSPGADRPRIGEILGAFDDKIAANDRVIEAAEALMLAIGRLPRIRAVVEPMSR